MILGGLALFLYAVTNLSDTLKEFLGDKAKAVLQRFTGNIFMSLLTGTIITIILDSSSAVIIMTIVFVNAGALSFKNAMGIVMAANVGTTFSSQLIALDIGKYSPVVMVAGIVLVFIGKSDKMKAGGKALTYFGILFFGLYTMEHAVEPLRDNNFFHSFMAKLNAPLKGAGAGALVTLIIQSSSATMGIVITLAKKQLIGFPAAIAVMLGAELGTCSDTLLATIRSNRQAVKTGLFHLFFNVVSITIGLLLFPYFIAFIERISGGARLEQKIANAHMIFNIGGVILFLPFIKYIEKGLNKLVPEKVVVPPVVPPGP